MPVAEAHAWPQSPYKGLSWYGPDDTPIFAGRDGDVRNCAKFLAAASTRILILHGSTGCGKSSFLRAGLIPFLEAPEHGFSFLHEQSRWPESPSVNPLRLGGGDGAEKEAAKAIFVRSTDAPLAKLAERLYEFASAGYSIETPIGPSRIDMSSALLGYGEREGFLGDVGKNGLRMIEALAALAKQYPKTLVLVIDQAEEVLSVKQGADGDEARSQFFDFLASFSANAIDLKLLVALRTEWYGRFFNEIRRREWDTVNIREYLLQDLTEQQLALAIEHPTTKTPIDGYGVPYRQYNFCYAPGLPAKIATDLMRAAPQGGRLPVLQIVCDTLYRKTKEKVAGAPWVIEEEDYAALGRVEGQMGTRLNDVLRELCTHARIPGKAVLDECDRWRSVLSLLAKSQVDGTVTTDLQTEVELREAARLYGCKVDFDLASVFLADEEKRIVQRVEVLNQATNEKVVCYSLGHDAIGLALRSWKKEHDSRQSELRALHGKNRRSNFRGAGMFLVLSGALWVLGMGVVMWYSLLYSLMFLLLAFLGPGAHRTMHEWLIRFFILRSQLERMVERPEFRRRLHQDPHLRQIVEGRLRRTIPVSASLTE